VFLLVMHKIQRLRLLDLETNMIVESVHVEFIENKLKKSKS
jgi:hypothetical protein